ncbi:MAG TPA: TIGR03936 family radical SAM-associated protein, partial [Polyangiaceae bacterium]|nr:TIGR03936 family radical SAM-associated protein [Polyangiaceae bacterium]
SLSVASLRAYGLAEDLLDDMRKVRAAGLTFAPEAGTQRMRDVINKNVTEEQLLETAERVFSRGYDRMKLYFILGLPTETDEDVLGIAEVGKNAFLVGKRSASKRPQVTVSVSVHVPKPHTPFQWAKMDDLAEVERKQQLLKDELRTWKGVALKLHDSTTSELEGVLARGDRRLADVIEHAYRHGAVFDSWDEHHRPELWGAALREFGIDTAPFLSTIPLDARLPWDHVDVGLEDGFLAREYRKALQSRLSPPCGKAKGMFIHHTNVAEATADERKLVCYDCGIACDMGRMRENRVDYLSRMGAAEPGVRRLPLLAQGESADREAQAREQAKRARPERPEELRPERTGGPAERFRLQFQKTGPMALLGHLDLIKELPRVVRRAGVRTAYTEGFHPRADISFSPALALGVASLDEYLDISLIGAPSAGELVERLNQVATHGLRFVAGARLDSTDKPLSKVIDEARYVVGVSARALSDAGIPPLEQLLTEFLAADERVVLRDTQGIKRKIDARASVLSLRPHDDELLGQLRSAGIVGEVHCFEVALGVGPQGSVRLLELMEALTGRTGVPYVAVRSAMIGQGRRPLELEAHKKPEPQRRRPVSEPILDA